MKSKTLIEKQTKKKTNPELVETIRLAKKADNIELAGLLSTPTKKRISLNLEEIEKESKDGETIIVPGKVLGKGELGKKVKIIAFSFSGSAIEKLKKAKIQHSFIKEELGKNKKMEGRILK